MYSKTIYTVDVCFWTQLPLHLRFSLFYKGMPVWSNKLKTQVKKHSVVYIQSENYSFLLRISSRIKPYNWSTPKSDN